MGVRPAHCYTVHHRGRRALLLTSRQGSQACRGSVTGPEPPRSTSQACAVQVPVFPQQPLSLSHGKGALDITVSEEPEGRPIGWGLARNSV